ncbi:MAG TPA: tetratricopeptide repeat protein [Anaerolinea sp.]|nr:tetratricopeptide repeat protein [Anaerolinea sp.]
MALQQNTAKTQNLESQLDEAEKILGRLSFGVGVGAFQVLELLDLAKQRLDQLSTHESSPRAERAQFEAVCATLRKEGREFLKQIGGVNALRARREASQPPRENWWWYLDEELGSAQRLSMLRTLRSAGIALVVILVAVVVYRVVFSPDPKVIAVVDAQQNADLQLNDGKLEDALTTIDAGLGKVPDSPDLLVYKAVILQELGRTAEAQPIFDQAQKLVNDQEVFLLTQAQILNMMNRPQKAVDLMLGLLKDYPDSGRGYLLLGQAYELMGNQQDALSSYSQAAAVGEANGDSTTTAQARIKMAMLMQVFGLPQMGLTPSPSTSP